MRDALFIYFLDSSGDADRRNRRQPTLPQGHPQDIWYAEQQQRHAVLSAEHARGALLRGPATGRISQIQVRPGSAGLTAACPGSDVLPHCFCLYSCPPKDDGSADLGSITTVTRQTISKIREASENVAARSLLLSFVSSQYYHSVRVFAGQDPASVWVGWVTPDYHYYSKNFNLGKTRTVTVTLGDERGRVHERQAAVCLCVQVPLSALYFCYRSHVVPSPTSETFASYGQNSEYRLSYSFVDSFL